MARALWSDRWFLLGFLCVVLGTWTAAEQVMARTAPFATAGAAEDDDDDDDDDEDEDDEDDDEGDDESEGGDESDDEDEPDSNLDVPDSLPAQVRDAIALSTAAHATGDPQPIKAAIKAMEAAKTAAPSCPLPHYYLGLLYLDRKEVAKSRAALKRAVELNPKFYEAHTLLGDVAHFEHKPDAAIPHYTRALEIHPKYLNAAHMLPEALIEVGRFKDARGHLDRALKIWASSNLVDLSKELDLTINGPPWKKTYTVDSDNYIVKTDVSQALAGQASQAAELIREIYDIAFPDVPKSDRKYIVFIFKSRDDYLAAGARENTAGYYDPTFRRLNLYQQDSLFDTLMVLKHEGFHQYCHEVLQFIPQWFNEGLADYFGSSEVSETRGKATIKVVPNDWRLRTIARAVGDRACPSAQELMLMSQGEMYAEHAVHIHYAQAWAICHFCIEGGEAKYTSALKKYFKALTNGKDQEEAYEASFKKLDMSAFEEGWRSHVRKLVESDNGRHGR